MKQKFYSAPQKLTDADLPREFRLFHFGENKSTKGSVYLTQASAKKCLKAWQDYGNELAGDYEHAVTTTAAEGAPASCWFGLAVKSDGIYAVNVRWTERAASFLKNREYRYFSPYFNTERFRDTVGNCYIWVVTEIYNLALTNQPATLNQKPLVARAFAIHTPQRKEKFSMMSPEKIDEFKKGLIEKGVPEDKASDVALFCLAFCEMSEEAPAPEAMPSEPMPMADPQPIAEEPSAMSAALSALQAQLKSATSEIQALKKAEAERATEKRSQLFDRYKAEGRLRLVSEKDAKQMLDKHGEDAFRLAFGSVAPLTENKPPKAPESAPSVTEIKKDQKMVEGLLAPVVDPSEVQAWMAKPENKNKSFREGVKALSRNPK